MAMLKADAYGHGALACARALAARVDGFGVARLDEAEKLRQALPDCTILLTAAALDAEALAWCAAHKVAIVVHEQAILAELLRMAQTPAVWLKLNTGMSRLGFAPTDYIAALQQLRERGIPVVAMTHFACADEPDRAPTLRQIRRFTQLLKACPDCPRSLANSAGLVAYPQSQAEWVRPGIMLYGSNPMTQPIDLGLRPVMRLQARILAVSTIPAGAAVGYGATWQAPRTSRIATVGIGYGDGYPRVVNGAAVAGVNGRPAPLAGRVSMDLLAVDVTDVAAGVGDIVTLWGDDPGVDRIASAAGTISYELLCRVQSRVPRIYRD